MSDLRGVLFDVDGTLVDTTYLHTVCWWQAFRQAGLDAPMAVIHRSIGMGGDRLVPQVLDVIDAPPSDQSLDERIESMSNSHDALYSTFWPALRPLPGARDLLRHCHASGLITVLASSANARDVAVLRVVLDCDDVIDDATSSDDADSSKPDPDLVVVALKKANLQPDEALFVGDAVWDVEASAKAGVRCIGLESGGTSASELLRAGAVRTFTDPAALLAGWDLIAG
jgi:HAD superfamily hydrolase (TIGR01509 family)